MGAKYSHKWCEYSPKHQKNLNKYEGSAVCYHCPPPICLLDLCGFGYFGGPRNPSNESADAVGSILPS